MSEHEQAAMKYVFNRGHQCEQTIEVLNIQNSVVMNILRAPYNEHDVDVSMSKEALREFAVQILEFLDG